MGGVSVSGQCSYHRRWALWWRYCLLALYPCFSTFSISCPGACLKYKRFYCFACSRTMKAVQNAALFFRIPKIPGTKAASIIGAFVPPEPTNVNARTRNVNIKISVPTRKITDFEVRFRLRRVRNMDGQKHRNARGERSFVVTLSPHNLFTDRGLAHVHHVANAGAL